MNSISMPGKTVVITGAASGIGKAAASVFTEAQMNVVLADISRDQLSAVAKELAGGTVAYKTTDVSSEDEVKELVEFTIDRFGTLDCAFNNAGTFGKFQTLTEDSVENVDRVLAVNVRGPWLCMKYEIPAMLRSGGGAIVNTSSVAGHLGNIRSAVYTASKHGVIGLTKAAALMYANAGIRVNALSPGSTDTEMLRNIYSETAEFKRRAGRAPMGRLGLPEELARTALFLLSPMASYITGQAIVCDGGVTAGQGPQRQ